MSVKEEVYSKLPWWLQNIGCSAVGWHIQHKRYGDGYGDILYKTIQQNSLEGEDLEVFQQRAAAAQLRAANRTPYWRRAFQEFGVNINSEDALGQLKKLPILTKDQVKQYASEIINPVFDPKAIRKVKTSGTTGSGLKFVETPLAEKIRWATWWRFRVSHGINPAMWCAYFGGRSIVPISQKKAPYWRINRPGRQLMFSAYHIKRETIAAYVSAFRKYRPIWVHGYPSVISLFADFVVSEGLAPLDSVRIVTTGAENLLPYQRQQIEAAFNCEIRQHYGLAESVANISENKEGELIIDEDFSVVELISISGAPNTYRLIGSNVTNPAFPLLRYDTGDLVFTYQDTSHDSRGWRIVENIDGRKEDFVTLPDGRKLGRLDHIFKTITTIREAQLYQPKSDRLVLRIVPSADYLEVRDEPVLLREARKRLGTSIKLEVHYVSAIERTANGKLRFVVSDIS